MTDAPITPDTLTGDKPTPGTPTVPIFTEAGVTGLKKTGGVVIEEYLTQLRGTQGVKVYAEMETDPLIGGVLLAMTEIINRLDWQFVPPDNPTPEEEAQARFAEECREDMSDSWDVTLSEILSMLPYGWSYHEQLFKRRLGQNPGVDADGNELPSSRFSDGKIGWRKFAIRGQDSLVRWEFDPSGGVQGMVQQDQFSAGSNATGMSTAPQAGALGSPGGMRGVPIGKSLLFRTSERKGNPEGRSLLRGAYRPWYYKKRIEEIEAIGIERDFAGMPLVYAPPEWFTPGDVDGARMLGTVKEMIRNAKRNELDGVLLPAVFDADTSNRLLSFELVSSGGSRQFSTNEVVGRYNNAIATSMLMDFMTMGHEGVGSYALGAAKISMWQLVVESIAKGIAAVVNRHAVPLLMRLNGWVPDRMPELVFGDVAQPDLQVLGGFLQQMIDSGVIVPDSRLESYVRTLINVPEGDMDESDDTPAPVEEPVPSTAGEPTVSAPAAPEVPGERTVGA